MALEKEIERLKKDRKFQSFIKDLYVGDQYLGGRRDIALIITGDYQIPISPEGVERQFHSPGNNGYTRLRQH